MKKNKKKCKKCDKCKFCKDRQRRMEKARLLLASKKQKEADQETIYK